MLARERSVMGRLGPVGRRASRSRFFRRRARPPGRQAHEQHPRRRVDHVERRERHLQDGVAVEPQLGPRDVGGREHRREAAQDVDERLFDELVDIVLTRFKSSRRTTEALGSVLSAAPTCLDVPLAA